MSDFENLVDRLAAARARYEDLQTAGAPLTERVHARTALHALRSQAGAARYRSTEGV